MTAITAAVNRQYKGTYQQRGYAMTASTTIVKGSLVQADATTGLAKSAVTGVAADTVVGVALETVTSAASGTYNIQVGYGAEWLFACTASIAQGTVGDTMYITDNNTLTLTSTTAAIVGRLTQFVSTTLGWAYVQGASVAV